MRTSLRSPSSRDLAFDQAVAEAMRTPVTDAIDTQSPSASDPAAGTPGTEGEPSDAVAAVAAVRDAGSEPDYSDRVEHDDTIARWVAEQKRREEEFVRGPFDFKREEERRARLRRWQAVDPRERKA